MLHEILLSLSGHPSPLLTADHESPTQILSPPEKALLSSIAHLSELHCKLLAHTSTIISTHPSSICQAVATTIRSVHLAAFQRKVLEVEDGILRRDAGSVGAYNIVPLTAIVGQFSEWTRRMEWFLEVVEYMMRGHGGGKKCSGPMIIDWLCNALQTGYVDIEEAALSLVKVAETSWLKQVSGWVLYGRLPGFGREDFFIQQVDGDIEEYESKKELLPAFVTTSTAASLLFVGRSLNHIRVKGMSSATSSELSLLSKHLRELSTLKFPINSANFSRVIASIRLSLSKTTLQKLLPLSKVIEVLSLLREFFLLGRGEFAIALISEADDKIRQRWRRSDNLGYEKRDGLGNIVVKDGEVSTVLTRTWAAMGLLQGQDEDQDEDDILELARDLVQLVITKNFAPTPIKTSLDTSPVAKIATTPFRTLLLSVPVALTMHIPSPIDLFLAPSDVHIYTSINAYLLSIHRAHLRLTDMWKITSLRRDHPAPPGPPYGSSNFGRSKVLTLRHRAKERSAAMRTVWATSSAGVFFLGETEAYLQGEVVQGTWTGFKNWLSGETASRPTSSSQDVDEDEDIWMQAGRETPTLTGILHTHDPQSLADAHRRYLSALASSLLLTIPSFTDPLFHLLQQIDHLVALVHRIHSIWQSLDLEADEGVVDAFSDFHKEEKDVRAQLVVIAGRVKGAIEVLVGCLREVDQSKEGWSDGFEELVLGEEGAYVPAKVGRVDRLLMKLDFGGWFDGGKKAGGLDDLRFDDDDIL
ncbi:gamma-tubulin complex component protein [Tricladium varicosporioides]|nr:gamma-tubulin complex component protein [Hymenoscyphus varicosporioides]